MNYVLLINGLLCLLFFIFFIVNYFKHLGDELKRRCVNALLMVMALYFVFAVLFFLWFLGVFAYSQKDFLLVYSVALIVQTFLFLRMGSFFRKSKGFYFLTAGYAALLLLMLYSPALFTKYSPIASFFVMGFLFLQLFFLGEKFKKIAGIGLLYSILSIILMGLAVWAGSGFIWVFFVSTVILFGFIFLFFRDIRKYSFEEETPLHNPYLQFLAHLVFVVMSINLFFIGTVVIHEFGHYGMSYLYDCEYRQIVYKGDLFHTEVLCSNIGNEVPVILGGVIAPYVLALFLFFLKEKFFFDVGILIAGFNSISVSRDFSDLGLSTSIVFASVILGILLIIYGSLSLIKSRVDITRL